MGSASGVFRVTKINPKSAFNHLKSTLDLLEISSVSSHAKRSRIMRGALGVSLTLPLALLLALPGCTNNAPWNGSTGAAVPITAVDHEELARRSIFKPSAEKSQNSFAMDLVERENASDIEIVLPKSASNKPQVTALESPARIVIDLEGTQGPKSSTIETPESLYVSRVRIGEHPDKSRIVLDMNEDRQVNPILQQTGERNYIIKIAKANILAETPKTAPLVADSRIAAKANVESPKTSQTAKLIEDTSASTTAELNSIEPKSNIKSNIEVALNSKQVKTEKTDLHFSEPKDSDSSPMASPDLDSNELKDAAVDSKALKPNKISSSATVYSYQLQAISPSENTLLIEGDQLSRYTLKRTAPSEYVLRLPGASLADGAQEAIVAPQGSGAIRSVRAKPAGDVLELRIFTAPEESLEIKGTKDSLVVAASSGFDFSNALAQVKPELAKDAAKESSKSSSSKDVSLVSANSGDSEISTLLGEQPRYTGRLISLDLQDTDIDNALRIIAEVSNLNIIASEEVTGKITLRLIDVPWDQALDVILKTNGLDMIQENNVIRIAPVEKLRAEREALKQSRQAEEELEPLSVRYVRISYAKAAELKPLVESVLSERGSVAYDDRTNQLIIKDIRKGVINVAELIAKLDLRTPQVLLETQIVEATRTLSRDLGSEFGFNFVQSPATGNATGNNFPNSIAIGGSGTNGNASSFPGSDSSAVTFLLQSADGTKSLSTRLTALEQEGRVKVVSRPSVATTNNKQATIKSIEKIRVKQPSGGTSVATGQGASANGTTSATETIEIGIILEVTPQASPDYYVLLDINAKSSTLGSTVVDGIPSEIERSATSSVLVSSGQTFAMGGIYKTTDSNTVEGVPFLKDIPVLGHLFRRVQVSDQDEELLFFITPRIIEGSFDDAAMKAT